eukprot:s1202_g17.t1
MSNQELTVRVSTPRENMCTWPHLARGSCFEVKTSCPALGVASHPMPAALVKHPRSHLHGTARTVGDSVETEPVVGSGRCCLLSSKKTVSVGCAEYRGTFANEAVQRPTGYWTLYPNSVLFRPSQGFCTDLGSSWEPICIRSRNGHRNGHPRRYESLRQFGCKLA